MPECFIIMPITTPEAMAPLYGGDKDHFQHVLDHLFKPAIEKAGLTPVPPAAEGSDVIHAEIIKNIEKADLVLCDMSCLNPNVFFELGIRTAVDKPVCMVKDELTPKVPFDTGIINHHHIVFSRMKLFHASTGIRTKRRSLRSSPPAMLMARSFPSSIKSYTCPTSQRSLAATSQA